MFVMVHARLELMPGRSEKHTRMMATRSTLVTHMPRKRNQLILGLSAGSTGAGGALVFCRLDKTINAIEFKTNIYLTLMEDTEQYRVSLASSIPSQWHARCVP